ncbi:MAG: hydroxyacylglutathione hydrolase family protein [Thermoplasmatota archaeon]
MVVRQLRVGTDNFSYLIHDPLSHEAALVDPGMDASKALGIIMDEGLDLKFVINTHHHSDHVAANVEVMKETGAMIVASREDGSHLSREPDIWVSDGDEIELGERVIRFLKTPGHTPGGLCIIAENEFLLTGDTLFIGDCGRCDLPGGSLKDMFQSLQRLKGLNDDLVVFPGHDYGDRPYDTLGNQKRRSRVLTVESLEEFSRL